MPNPIMFLGMAIQALATSFLMSKGLIQVSPMQQGIAGIIYLFACVAIYLVTPKK